MRFLQKNKTKKTILVISDIHLGAGVYVHGKRNYLEDFHSDKELVDFLDYFSTGDYQNREVELIINGDLFDFLAVPFVHHFDDTFWSEKASLEKYDMIAAAHTEVLEALSRFVSGKKKNLVYIIGNHDAEFIFESLQNKFFEIFDEKDREKVSFVGNKGGEYQPYEGILVQHGHDYEIAHSFDPKDSIIEDEDGNKYFIPPWGSYYVTRLINKFKQDRPHINAVRPIYKFMVNGFIYDTLFTVRFGFAHIAYFIMVRTIYFFKTSNSIFKVLKMALSELELFQDFETLTRSLFEKRPDIDLLIVGHTHEPMHRTIEEGRYFMNTGTWTRMYNLDFGKNAYDGCLTFAQINIKEDSKGREDRFEATLNSWKGRATYPYSELT
jgi:UDP-2,3-diacylglucosamine pyrophosphatase LpxH